MASTQEGAGGKKGDRTEESGMERGIFGSEERLSETEVEMMISDLDLNKISGSTSVFSDADLKSLETELPLDALDDLDMGEFEGFGMKNSKVYRELLFRLFKVSGIKKEYRIYVIFLATLCKNKDRILRELKNRFTTAAWYQDVSGFFGTYTSQYVSDAEKSGTMPVVNIPNCVPHIAAYCLVVSRQAETMTYKDILANTWACQLNLDDRMMIEQLKWEMDFWDMEVKTTKNRDKSAFNANKGFQKAFWKTKAKDNYPLINRDYSPFTKFGVRITEKDLTDYIKEYARRGDQSDLGGGGPGPDDSDQQDQFGGGLQPPSQASGSAGAGRGGGGGGPKIYKHDSSTPVKEVKTIDEHLAEGKPFVSIKTLMADLPTSSKSYKTTLTRRAPKALQNLKDAYDTRAQLKTEQAAKDIAVIRNAVEELRSVVYLKNQVDTYFPFPIASD